jgi:aminomuconate-semialdehyde/2-hydroxymuconate-6-semialdehyde dehydrogenase
MTGESSSREMKHFIDGQFVVSGSGCQFDNFDPVVGKTFARVHEASEDDVDRAVCAARAAFKGPWDA